MSDTVQSSVFKNAGIKRNNKLIDTYTNEDFNIEHIGDEVDGSMFVDTHLADSVNSSLGDKNFFDFDLGDMDLKGMGSIAQGIGSIWDAYNKKEYQDEIVKMEKDRVNREVAKQAKAQNAFDAAWA